ncbi:MAG TPA: hypothetical protein VFS39_06155 [Nitrospira sp.]|nr:hypothetical protein [Nitrospira sp.]
MKAQISLTRLLTGLWIVIGALLFKRLITRKPRRLPYRKAESKWPQRSYREPS